jgi:hypothetical protein
MNDSTDQTRIVIKELAIKEADRRWDEAAERLRYSVEYAQAGLKSLFLANGAGIIGLLTFVGNSDAVIKPTNLWWAFACFSVGLASVLAAYVAAYMSQTSIMNAAFNQSRNAESAAYDIGKTYDDKKFETNGEREVKAGVAAAVFGLISFVSGAFVALDAIT